MITWTKPSGTELTTNDSKETIKYCESLGFKRKDAKTEKKVEKKTKGK